MDKAKMAAEALGRGSVANARRRPKGFRRIDFLLPAIIKIIGLQSSAPNTDKEEYSRIYDHVVKMMLCH